MGGIVSTLPMGVSKEWMNIFAAMKLTREEINLLLQVYNKVDQDKSGNIDVVELLTLLDIERTKFTEKIFSAFDKDHTGQIDFYEFVVSVWKFCTLGEGATSVFAFDIFDTDADGVLSYEQVLNMFSGLTGSRMNDSENENIRIALVKLTKLTRDQSVGIEDFKKFAKTHQALLCSVYAVQHKLKLATLGEGMWENIARRRVQVQPGMNIQLHELMVLHSDRQKFRSLLEDQTAMRIDSMMKIVLENTDNCAHHAAATAAFAAASADTQTSVSAPGSPAAAMRSPKSKSPKKKGALPKDLLHASS